MSYNASRKKCCAAIFFRLCYKQVFRIYFPIFKIAILSKKKNTCMELPGDVVGLT